ncbi:MAG: site-2 protease family protein [Candidatus Aenigmarchaeota archaeon]|nr:site-2 protease family protein [Candidatus Aenigmarchaeota archaeon]
MIDHSIIAFIIFVLAVGLFMYRDRKNVKREGIVFMRRTEKGKKSIDNSVKKHPTFWRIMGITGLVIAIPAMIFISYFVVSNGITVLSGVKTETVKIVLPWTEQGSQPGVFFVPWYFWIIGIAAIIIPHELFHGFMCRLHKIKIKSLGWFLLIVLPGAFVEPDKKSLDNANLKAKLKVAAAGSFANIITAVIALAISFALIFTLFAPVGISVGVIANNTYPAYNANMSGYITDINNMQIRSTNDLVVAMDAVKPGDDVKIITNKGNYVIKTIENPDKPGKAFIGIVPRAPVNQPKEANTAPVVNFFSDLFMWIFILSLGIGLFNLLPIKPLDGGMMFEETLKSKIPKYSKHITIAVSLILVAFIIISLVGPLLL